MAYCYGCDKEHPVAARPVQRGTTKCPDCGSTTYRSIVDERTARDEAVRIQEAVEDISGVGAQTCENIKSEFTTYDQLAKADPDRLVTIDGVGKTVAERINERAV